MTGAVLDALASRFGLGVAAAAHTAHNLLLEWRSRRAARPRTRAGAAPPPVVPSAPWPEEVPA